jgi:hypothetical protein
MGKRKSWIVTINCEVKKSIVCDNCTEEDAFNDPFFYSVEETEIDMINWEVIKVEPND